MDYSKLSDFEINKRVANALGYQTGWQKSNSQAIGIDDGTIDGRYVDYCNNPAHAWPIIVENRICITFGAGAGSALHVRGGNTYQYVASKERMLRAAMIVFLMMQEGAE